MSSAEEIDEASLYLLGEDKIKNGKQLIVQLDKLSNINGKTKIQKKISSEVISLEKVSHNQGFVKFIEDLNQLIDFEYSNFRFMNECQYSRPSPRKP